jgi:hypothetical protein
VRKSLAERIARAIDDESPSLDLIGNEVRHKEILNGALAALREIEQKTLQRPFQVLGRITQESIDSWWNQSVGPELERLIGFMGSLNLREQVAVCVARASVLTHAIASTTKITGKFLDKIKDLPKDAQAEIFMVKNDDDETLPMLVVKQTPEVIGRLLDIVNGLDKGIQVTIFMAQNRNANDFSTLVAKHAPEATGKLLKNLEGLEKYVAIEQEKATAAARQEIAAGKKTAIAAQIALIEAGQQAGRQKKVIATAIRHLQGK